MGLLVTPQPVDLNLRRHPTHALARFNKVMRLPDVCSKIGHKPNRPVRWFHPFAAATLFCQRMGCWCSFEYDDLANFRMPNFKRNFRDTGLSFAKRFRIFITEATMLVTEIETFASSFELEIQAFKVKDPRTGKWREIPAGQNWKPIDEVTWYQFTDLGKEIAARVWLDSWGK